VELDVHNRRAAAEKQTCKHCDDRVKLAHRPNENYANVRI
jgi:hypothetical protein